MPRPIRKISQLKKEQEKSTYLRLSINYFIYESNRTKYKPYIDYDATVVAVGNKGYFISGRKESPVVVFDRDDNSWKEEHFQNLKPFGESAFSILNSDELIFFGGIRFYQPGVSILTNSVQIINLKSKTNKFIEFNQNQVSPRAFHAQCLYGQFLIVSGGVDKNYHSQNDFLTYNYVKNYWNKLQISLKPEILKNGFSKHKMLPIFHKRKRYLIYEETKIIQHEQIQHEGIYIFGGQDGDLKLSNKLYILLMGRIQLEIKQLQPKGQSPSPRKSFSMIRVKNYIVIHGGKNDDLSPFTLNSIHFLDLKILEWKVIKGDYRIYRYGHCLMNYLDSEVVIFGGKTDEGLSKEIYPLEIEEVKMD